MTQPSSFIRHSDRMARRGIARLTCQWTLALSIGLGVSLAPPAHAAGKDGYLDAIEAEGNRLEFLGKAKKEQEMLLRHTQAPASTLAKPQAAIPPNSTPAPATTAGPAVTQVQFERVLKERLPGSFALYDLLEQREKEAVFREYASAKSEGTIRFLPAVNKIIALTSASNKSR